MATSRGRTCNTRTQVSPKAQISMETQQLLKLMMEESKLTNFQRRQLNSRVKDGKALPVSCNPTSSKQRNNTSPKPQAPKKAMNGKSLGVCGKRPKEVIDVLVEMNAEPYKPLPGKMITEKDKMKLQNKMAFGDDLPDVDIPRNKIRIEVSDESEIDEFDDILNQIEERQQFLKDMESLGQGKKYRPIIQTEISQKIREMEIIDKQRTMQLEELLQTNEGNSNPS